MQQALEEALDRADCLIESAQLRPPKRKCLSSGRKSIFQKLYDLYVEECEKEPEGVQELRTNVNLLEKLVMRENLSCLVVNLYPGNEGYTLMLSGENGSQFETIQLPYEEKELLEYLDAEELPPILVDLLENFQVNIFYSGCVIAEIRDYRQCSNMQSPGYQSRRVLLRPTMQTLACDVHSITSDNHKWTQEDKLVLESQLILATAEPLCLDPSVAVACTANRLLYNKQKMNTHSMQRCFKRYSRPSLSQPLEVSDCQPPPQLTSFASCQKSKRKAGHQYDLKISKAGNCVDMWKQSPCNLAMPSEVDVEKYTKVEKSVIPAVSQPTVWAACEVNDDYLFDSEAGNQYQKTTRSVMQSLDDPLLSGTIQPCEEDEESVSEVSPFHFSTDDHSYCLMVGPEAAAERAVNQYQDLVQKECPVRNPHSSSGSASLSRSPRKEIEQPQRVLVQSSVLGKEVKHPPPPIKLPSSSGSSSSVNYSTPQQANSFLKSPTLPLSKPPVPSQKSSVNLRVSTLSPAAPSPASSSLRTKTTIVMVKYVKRNSTNAVGSVRGAQASVNGSDPVLSCSPGAKSPAKTNLSSCQPSGVLLPTAAPGAMQVASQAGVPLIIKNTSIIRPLTLLQIPSSQLILVPQQQQQLSRFTPQQLRQHPTARPQQPWGQGSAQDSTSQAQSLPTQQAVVINITKSQRLVPSQAAVLSQHASAQKRPEQSLPHQRVQIPAALPQQEPQIQQSKILEHPVSVAEAATQTPPLRRHHRHTGSHSKGKMKTSTSTSPKS
ncbi:transcription factor SPT20 homolog [Dugong dugon]